jgi:hypothetical protein
MLWSKGLGSLMELLKYAEESAGIKIHVDMYGGGPDKDAAEARANSLDVDMAFHGPIDHPELAFTHKVSSNPPPWRSLQHLQTQISQTNKKYIYILLDFHQSIYQ